MDKGETGQGRKKKETCPIQKSKRNKTPRRE